MNATTTKIGYNMFVVTMKMISVFEGIPQSVAKCVYGGSVTKKIVGVVKLKRWEIRTDRLEYAK
jgi:hypothetical protein